jgi:hypothetical protein
VVYFDVLLLLPCGLTYMIYVDVLLLLPWDLIYMVDFDVSLLLPCGHSFNTFQINTSVSKYYDISFLCDVNLSSHTYWQYTESGFFFLFFFFY